MLLQPDLATLVAHAPHDLGGLPEGPVVQSDHDMTPFEKNCHALLNVLASHLLVNTEEKRRGVEDMGATIIGHLSYYQRWALSAVKILNEKGIVTLAELGARMHELESRLASDLTTDPATDRLAARP